MTECKFDNGITELNIAGIPVDPCVYEVVETHYGVTVEVLRCPKCGKTEILWHKENADG